jgi:hypothetical protein
MRRNLWLLDLILLIAVVITGFVLKQRWSTASVREQALLQQAVPVPPAPALPAMPRVNPVTAATYMTAVQMNLFSKDRNPNVILDPPPPPPPPPQMPPLPVAYGVMDLGGGPTAILAEKPGAAHKGYRPGEKIGAFRIVAMNNREILFDWDGQPVKKTLEELADHRPTMTSSGTTAADAPPAATTAAAPAQPALKTLADVKGPGTDLGNQTRACAPGDTSAAGSVQDGMRKVVTKSPFGDVCRWEPVK